MQAAALQVQALPDVRLRIHVDDASLTYTAENPAACAQGFKQAAELLKTKFQDELGLPFAPDKASVLYSYLRLTKELAKHMGGWTMAPYSKLGGVLA